MIFLRRMYRLTIQKFATRLQPVERLFKSLLKKLSGLSGCCVKLSNRNRFRGRSPMKRRSEPWVFVRVFDSTPDRRSGIMSTTVDVPCFRQGGCAEERRS